MNMHVRVLLLTHFIIDAEAATSVDWTMPTSPNRITIPVGETVHFSWSGTHAVYQSAGLSDYDACATSSGNTVAQSSRGGSWSNTFNAEGTYYYICPVGGHCGAGQKIAITVGSTQAAESGSSQENPCFPSSGNVVRADGTTATMDALKAGDHIVAFTTDGQRTIDTVTPLSLAKPDTKANAFLMLSVGSARNLTLTKEHHVPTGTTCCSVLRKARELVVGDTLWTMSDKSSFPVARKIISVTNVRLDGLHSPVLAAGGMPVVDGIVTAFDSIEVLTFASFGLSLLVHVCEATGTCAFLQRVFHGA